MAKIPHPDDPLTTEEAVAAIVFKDGESETIVVLDTVFLGQLAPKANAKWLLQQINRSLWSYT